MTNSVLAAGKTARAAEIDVQALHGRSVLVKSSRDRRTSPTAMRGSIEVRREPGRSPEVSIALEHPQMFTTRAHHREIRLEAAGIARLLASEHEGTLEYTIDDEL